MRDFSVSLDGLAKFVTVLVFALFAFAIVVSESAYIAALGGAVLLVTYAFAPRGYTVADGAITVRRLAGEKQVPLERVRAVRRATGDDLRGAIRLWASGGLFGYYGLFRTRNLGNSWWHATNRANAVVVETADGTVVLSPDDVEGFLAAVRPYARSGEQWTARVRAGGRSWALWIGIAVAAVAIGVALLAFLWNPGPPRYTLTADSLTIHDRLYPVTLRASEVEVSGIREVDPAAEPEWRTTARTNGFANSYYRAGWFRVQNGRKVRLYQARGTRLVLLPPRGEGAPVFYGAHDPERFIREVRAAWAGGRESARLRHR